jgi:uncharacterized protein YggE
MKKYLILIALMYSANLFSQCPTDTDTTKKVKVFGTAEVVLDVSSFILDIALKEMYIQPRNYSGPPELDQPMDSLEDKLKRVIQDLKLDVKNLKLVSINNMPSNSGNLEQSAISAIYELKIQKTEDVNRFLKNAKIKGLSGIRVRRQFDVDDSIVRAQLCKEALKDARQKADYLLSSVNKKTGDILLIDMNNHSNQAIIDDPNPENWNGYYGNMVQVQPKAIPMTLVVTYKIID